MASPQNVIFETLEHPDPSASSLPEAWTDRIAELKKQAGCLRVFFGRMIEDSSKGLICALWDSPSSASAVISQDKPESVGFGLTPTAADSDPYSWIEGPCTEIATANGLESGFLDNMQLFLAKIDADKAKGYLGSACGKTLDGDMARLVIGWESREAHLEAKSIPGGEYLIQLHTDFLGGIG
jgi:heme-degrading monooxygenase HmoA